MSACQACSPRSDGKAVVGSPPGGRRRGSGHSPAVAATSGATTRTCWPTGSDAPE